MLEIPVLGLISLTYSFLTPSWVKLPSWKVYVCSVYMSAEDDGENNTAQNDSFENHAQMRKVSREANFES
jgi:hypothetical protein